MKHPDGVTQVLEEIEMDLRKGNIDFKQADAARAAALAVSYRLAPKLDTALAACAEMRAALTEIIARGQEQRGTGRMIETAEAALARIDLGRGWVGPEVVRRVVERAVAPDGHCHLCIGVRGKHMEWCPVPDLDALLGDEKGGVK